MADRETKPAKDEPKRYKAADVVTKEKPKGEMQGLPKTLLELANDKHSKAYSVTLPDRVGYVVVHATGFATEGFDPSEMTEVLDDDLCRKGGGK